MAVEWTDDQRDVINVRKKNTLVSAAAGSGKTAVLVEHIISMVTDEKSPVDIDKILVVTFTRAAAAEMRERILTAIEEQSRLHPENEHLQKQQSYIHNAQITTIDSFCMQVVQEYFNELDMDPEFRIGDEGELKLIMSDVMDEMLKEYYEGGTEEFFEFVDEFTSGKTDKKISEYIMNLYNFIASRPDSKEWLLQCKNDYNISTVQELKNSKWITYLTDYADAILKEQLGKLKDSLKLCLKFPELEGYTNAIRDAYYFAEDLLKSDFDLRVNMLSTIQFERMGSIKNVLDEEIKAAKTGVKNTRDEFKDVVNLLKSDIYYANLNDLLNDIHGCAPSINVLVNLTIEFIERFEKEKSEKNIVDFTDIEQFAYRILLRKDERGKIIPSDIAKEMSKKYEEILIDEYQDSNLLQEYILNSVSKGQDVPNVFMVGDVKQSIYGFRHANPALFIEKYNTYDTNKDSLYWKKSLGKNFRSRIEVLDSVNAIFERLMNIDLGGIEYDEDSRLYEGAGYPKPPLYQNQETEVIYVENQYTGKEKIKYEAYAIIEKIKELMDPCNRFQVYDKNQKQYRDIQYRDIVILARNTKNIADIFAATFSEAGIPFYSERKTGYLESAEIRTMLNLLTIINNPLDDIPLAALMKSPIYSFTSMQLAEICSESKCEYLYDRIIEYIENGSDKEVKEKTIHFVNKLNEYREIVPYTSICDLIAMLYDDTNYYNYVSAMPDGRQKCKNLDILYDKSVSYEEGSYKGLFKFVKYIENIKKVEMDYGEASILGENDDIIRMMTIHKSKGLQFPVVITASLGNSFQTRDLIDSVVFHPDMGIGVDNIDSTLRVKANTIVKSAIKYAGKKEKYAEEMRVLYVALTRAEEKLILVASQRKVKEKLEKWKYEINSDILNVNSLLSSSSFIEWITAAIKGKDNKESYIKVRITEPNDFDIVMQSVKGGKLDIEQLSNDDKPADMKVVDEIKKRLNFKYNYNADTMMNSKTSVSRLKVNALEHDPVQDGAILIHDEVQEPVPEFVTGKQKLAGAGRGTAYHRLFEIFDFSIEPTEQNIKDMVERFHECGRIDDDTYDVVEIKDLLVFAASSLGIRMKRAFEKGRLLREQPYVMGIPADEINENCSPDELVLVQGVIDVCFEEDGEMVIADYKTDKVDNILQLVDRYKVQLDYYEKAITQITGMKVKEKIIYSVKLGGEISL